MNRRHFLALLGLGGVGGYYAIENLDAIEPPELFGFSPLDSSGDETTPQPDNADNEATWEREFQSALPDPPVYSDVTYADQQQSTSVNQSTRVNRVGVHPVTDGGDFFRFEAVPGAVAETATMIRTTVGLGEELKIDGHLAGEPVVFAGGEARIGAFLATVGVATEEPVIGVARGSDEDTIKSVLEKMENV